MPINYDSLRSTVDRLLGENGASGVLRRVEASAYDPVTDTETAATTDYPIKLVLSKVRSRDHDYDVEFIDKTYEGQALTKLIISPVNLPVRPRPGDKVIAGGVTWVVAGSNPVQPDTDAVVYICYGVQ